MHTVLVLDANGGAVRYFSDPFEIRNLYGKQILALQEIKKVDGQDSLFVIPRLYCILGYDYFLEAVIYVH